MQIHVSPSDGVPIYQQIVNQVKHLCAAGRLTQGEEIPPIRALAEQLLVNPNTIARAYLELERAGVVVKRHGAGTFIAGTGSRLSLRERRRILAQRADALLAEADHLDVPLESVIELLQERHTRMKPHAAR